MKISSVLLATLFAVIGNSALASDLLNQKAISGRNEGKLCKEVVQSLLSSQLGKKVKLLSYENLTPGSYAQEYKAVFTVGGDTKSAQLTGNFDCDDLEIQSID